MHVLSKVVWWVLDPANLLFAALVVGMLLLWSRWARFGKRLIAAAMGVWLLLAVVPVGLVGINWLENRIPPPAALPERVDGIVVLGGFVDQFMTESRGRPDLGSAVDRLTVFLELARRYPEARLVFSGGSGNLWRQDVSEAEAVRAVVADIGAPVGGRILYEDRSRNTYENAVNTKPLVQPQPGETWLLVTSAMHMPRALGCFRAQDWAVVPVPVDYQTRREEDLSLTFAPLTGPANLGGFLHELAGLTAYRLLGRTDTWVPRA